MLIFREHLVQVMSGKCIRWRASVGGASTQGCAMHTELAAHTKNREELVRISSLGLPRWKSGAKIQGSERWDVWMLCQLWSLSLAADLLPGRICPHS